MTPTQETVPGASGPAATQRIFISYKRDGNPDDAVARQVYQALSPQYHVFIDQESIPGGVYWAKYIEDEIRRADFMIALLSSTSTLSEMFEGEVELAHQCSKEKPGRPVIIPVRLAYKERLHYPLSAYLNHVQWLSWETAGDTPTLIANIRRALAHGKVVHDGARGNGAGDAHGSSTTMVPFPSAQLERPEGAIDPQSKFYEVRRGDQIALDAIRQQGVTITIKGPRQVGKSSLLIRVREAALQKQKQVVLIDFQQVGKNSLKSAELFCRQFCELISRKLNIESRVAEYWNMPLDDIMRCTQYMETHLLPKMDKPLVLAMDEVDSLFGNADFNSDFFSMLRSWHNSRAYEPLYKRLDLVLVSSTEPYQFIKDLNQSPFNVGEVIEPEDFTETQLNDLIGRHELTLDSTYKTGLMSLLGGHPYLVRRALYLIASGSVTTRGLFDAASEMRGPFGDHLRYHFFRLNGNDDLIAGLRQIIDEQKYNDDQVAYRLQSAGLVRMGGKRTAVPRCQLYADFFKEHLR
jgi:hypothetical protein